MVIIMVIIIVIIMATITGIMGILTFIIMHILIMVTTMRRITITEGRCIPTRMSLPV
jgi:hypothetical protein